MEIITYPNEILKTQCQAVKLPLSKEDKDTLTNMFHYLKEDTNNGIGLAAPQIGIAKALIAIRIKTSDGKVFALKLANPKVLKIGTATYVVKDGEKCLSEPDLEPVLVKRSKVILLTGYDDLTGKNISLKLTGFVAAVVQHEYDHLSGILLHDYIDTKD